MSEQRVRREDRESGVAAHPSAEEHRLSSEEILAVRGGVASRVERARAIAGLASALADGDWIDASRRPARTSRWTSALLIGACLLSFQLAPQPRWTEPSLEAALAGGDLTTFEVALSDRLGAPLEWARGGTGFRGPEGTRATSGLTVLAPVGLVLDPVRSLVWTAPPHTGELAITVEDELGRLVFRASAASDAGELALPVYLEDGAAYRVVLVDGSGRAGRTSHVFVVATEQDRAELDRALMELDARLADPALASYARAALFARAGAFGSAQAELERLLATLSADRRRALVEGLAGRLPPALERSLEALNARLQRTLRSSTNG
ncbi:MAG: hypothetical protein HZA52_02270 [Planctomycetes bacterium]|nr:hypothetical protein [Planctomycetota bacterium]